jgi:hypothetical protein
LIFSELKLKGFVVIDNYFSKEECLDLIQTTENLFQQYPEKVEKNSDFRLFISTCKNSLIMRFKTDKKINSLCNTYFAKPSTAVFTLTNKIDASIKGNKGSGEGWHRDTLFKNFKSIVYLNDVSEDNGPFQIIEGSHRLKSRLKAIREAGFKVRQVRVTPSQIQALESSTKMKTLTGKAGTLVLVDTACIHRGKPLISGARYALTNYFWPNSTKQYLINAFSSRNISMLNEE